jgi:hypothetical protein
MQVGLTEAQKAHYTDFVGPMIDNNFRQRPSAGPAFAQMTGSLKRCLKSDALDSCATPMTPN